MIITKPTVLVNKERVVRNITKILSRTKGKSIELRPHFKTHQCAGVGDWFREMGVTKISVSSVPMAAYFASHGWIDISICIPINVLLIPEINDLAKQARIHLLVDSREAVVSLAAKATSELGVWIEIDAGDKRTGIDSSQLDEILALAREIHAAQRLQFEGILTHAGNSYQAKSTGEIKEIYASSIDSMCLIKEHLVSYGLDGCKISIGDTPTSSVVESYDDRVDEMRPGNFIFYDLAQKNIGSCKEEEIALAVACPVISVHPERGEVVINGGAVHLSKDFYLDDKGKKVFGLVAWPDEKAGWTPHVEDMALRVVNQEHGIIRGPKEEIGRITIGDILVILPVHCCLCSNLFSELSTLDGERLPKFHL